MIFLSAGWWANPAHHGFNPNEPGFRWAVSKINLYWNLKKNSTQPDPNSWWAGLACGFQPILTALLNTMETTSTHILSLKPYTTNINKLNDTRIWFRRRLSCINIYNAIAYNIIKTGNCNSPNLNSGSKSALRILPYTIIDLHPWALLPSF